MKKLALILSGGGARGMAHVGALKIFDELGIKFDAIAGCSVGATIGAFYASGKSGQEIEDFINSNDIYRNFNFSFNSLGIKNITKLENLFEKFIGTDNFSQLKTPLYVNATNISSGQEVVFYKGSLKKAIRASIAVPGIFSPAEINNQYYIDGGVLNQIPFSIVPPNIKHYIIINVSPYKSLADKKKINLMDVLGTSIKIMQEQITKDKLQKLPKENYVLISPRVTKFNLLENAKNFKDILKSG